VLVILLCVMCLLFIMSRMVLEVSAML